LFVEVFLVGLLAGISPGPDFFIVMKNSLGFGSRVGIATALGIAAALIIHISYTILGFAFIIQQSPTLFHIIQFAGALYLIWLGWNALKSSAAETNLEMEKEKGRKKIMQGFRDGFLCNVLNPKATLFFLSIFSQFLHPDTSNAVRWIYGAEIILAVALWFTLLSVVISSARFKALYNKYRIWFDRLLGLTLLYFALRIIFSFVT
jgi:RhtB (resistance to homoserine/threonine) family protein